MYTGRESLGRRLALFRYSVDPQILAANLVSHQSQCRHVGQARLAPLREARRGKQSQENRARPQNYFQRIRVALAT